MPRSYRWIYPTTPVLPAGLRYPWNFAIRGHLTKYVTANAELTHISFGTARQLAAILESYRRCIAGKFVQRCVVASFFQSLAFCRIVSNQLLALRLPSYN